MARTNTDGTLWMAEISLDDQNKQILAFSHCTILCILMHQICVVFFTRFVRRLVVFFQSEGGNMHAMTRYAL